MVEVRHRVDLLVRRIHGSSGSVFFFIVLASPAPSSPPDYKELSLCLSEGLSS